MGKTGLPIWEHTGKDSPCQKEVFVMKAFQIPSKPSTTSKSIRFPNEVIEQAQAQAQAIMKVQQATADAIKLINEANPGDGVLKIKALEAFTAAANGKATKIIVPSEIQGLAGLAAAAKTVFDTEDPKPAAPKTTLPKQ